MKLNVDQGETQHACVHALSDSGLHIREQERRPGRTVKRFATAEISMRLAVTSTHRSAKSRAREAQFLFFSGTNRYS